MKKRRIVGLNGVVEQINENSPWELVPIFPELKAKNVKKRGQMFYLKCSFHQERQASLVWHSDSAKFHCYGCGWSGNIIDFYSKKTGKSFFASVISLAKFFHIKLRFENKLERKEEIGLE